MSEYYRYLDRQLNDALGTDLEFNILLGAKRYALEADELRGFSDRYPQIKEFQEITLSLFNASLKGEADPEIASLIVNELPESQGTKYHSELDLKHTPVFFRTDEVVPGKISEIQCPGSAWGICDQLHSFYDDHRSEFGDFDAFPSSLSEGFSETLKRHVGSNPIVHHLTDNSSIPHDMRYFIQKTRMKGIKYYSYDRGVTPYNCNFIRSHAFAGLAADNYFLERLARYKAGDLCYDLPPSILFDEKMIYILPFWEKTRRLYPDRIRDLFPWTQLIRPEGFTLEDGTQMNLESFCRLSQKNRDYYIKYAGSDLSINWGSKGVYRASSFSDSGLKFFLTDISNQYHEKRYWILQKAYHRREDSEYIARNGDISSMRVYTKISGFYGPAGLLGMLVMQRPFNKVHGTEETIVSLCR
jgi:hypothetical protein